MKNMFHPESASEIRLKVRQKDIIRKRFPKSIDQNALDNKHLASIPYNKENNMLDAQKLRDVFAIAGMNVKINDLGIYQRAFIHASYTVASHIDETEKGEEVTISDVRDEHLRSAIVALKQEGYLSQNFQGTLIPLQWNSSETLEFLGDSVCGMCVADYLYTRFPDEDEGFMTRLRTRLVCGSRLGEFAEKLGLQTHVIISRYVEIVSNGRKNYKVLEDIFEAFVGAMYLDNGRDSKICYDFIIAVIEKYIDFADLIANDTNMKDQLLRFYQKTFDGVFPVYRELSVDVKDGIKVYNVGVLNPEGTQIIATASARKKRASEQMASKKALEYYNVLAPEL